jgi:hypothetical protein
VVKVGTVVDIDSEFFELGVSEDASVFIRRGAVRSELPSEVAVGEVVEFEVVEFEVVPRSHVVFRPVVDVVAVERDC